MTGHRSRKRVCSKKFLNESLLKKVRDRDPQQGMQLPGPLFLVSVGALLSMSSAVAALWRIKGRAVTAAASPVVLF